jgi:hypothetical protein
LGTAVEFHGYCHLGIPEAFHQTPLSMLIWTPSAPVELPLMLNVPATMSAPRGRSTATDNASALDKVKSGGHRKVAKTAIIAHARRLEAIISPGIV